MDTKNTNKLAKVAGLSILGIGSFVLFCALIWQGITDSGVPDPTVASQNFASAIVNTGLLVFREGLETILVLSTLVAGFTLERSRLVKPVFTGAGIGVLASLASWFVAVGIVSDLSKDVSALSLQAATGALAIVVLLVVMNWFFHSIYWTGWLSMMGLKKKALVQAGSEGGAERKLLLGLMLLGFWSVYREGFELVLFLQSLRLQLGSLIVAEGVAVGLFFTAIAGALTFVGHRKLPYRQMLIWTGVMLGIVLLVMVGEEAQEMQQAGWISTTPIALPIPAWMGIWFSVFPNVESIAAQAVAAMLVIGSYLVAQYKNVWSKNKGSKWRF